MLDRCGRDDDKLEMPSSASASASASGSNSSQASSAASSCSSSAAPTPTSLLRARSMPCQSLSDSEAMVSFNSSDKTCHPEASERCGRFEVFDIVRGGSEGQEHHQIHQLHQLHRLHNEESATSEGAETSSENFNSRVSKTRMAGRFQVQDLDHNTLLLHHHHHHHHFEGPNPNDGDDELSAERERERTEIRARPPTTVAGRFEVSDLPAMSLSMNNQNHLHRVNNHREDGHNDTSSSGNGRSGGRNNCHSHGIVSGASKSLAAFSGIIHGHGHGYGHGHGAGSSRISGINGGGCDCENGCESRCCSGELRDASAADLLASLACKLRSLERQNAELRRRNRTLMLELERQHRRN